MTATPAIVRTTEWSKTYDGTEFRVAVLDHCPHCRVMEAHATQYRGRSDLNRCEVCTKTLGPLPEDAEETAAGPELVTSFAAHAAHTRATCSVCTVGRDCDRRLSLYSAMTRDLANCRTPYMVRRETRYSTGYVDVRTYGCLTLQEAEATAGVQGGEVIDQTHLFRI